MPIGSLALLAGFALAASPPTAPRPAATPRPGAPAPVRTLQIYPAMQPQAPVQALPQTPPQPAHQERVVSRPSRVSSEIQAIKAGSTLGILFGWRYMSYESDVFAIGGAAYTGQINTGGSGFYSYGGMIASFGGRVIGKIEMELSMLAGVAASTPGSTGSLAGGVAMVPSGSLGFILGKSARLGLSAGFVWLPSAGASSGLTFGPRFDFHLNQE